MPITVTVVRPPYFQPTTPDSLLVDVLITLADASQVAYTHTIDGWKAMTVAEVGQVLLDTFARLVESYALVGTFAVLNGQSASSDDLVPQLRLSGKEPS